jgi:EAL domain-containing protein (putative c-di-GMP-specific phosphodiesterase class I)
LKPRLSSLSYDELKALELQLCQVLNQLNQWHLCARLTDLTFGFVVTRKTVLELTSKNFQSPEMALSGIRINLAWSRVAIFPDKISHTFIEAYSALQEALEQPMIRTCERLTHISNTKTSLFTQYQQITEALDDNRLILFGQKILCLNNHNLTIEVLCRIDNQQDNLMSPGDFLPVLRAFDDLERLDRQVISSFVEQTKDQAYLWSTFEKFNINITGSTLCDQDFVEWLTLQWDPSIPKHKVCFEITESDFIRNWMFATQSVSKLKQLGFLIAIDDFGSGLASYEYIKRFSVDLIKLDGQFVHELSKYPIHQAMVQATVKIARSMNLQVCAEFVDSQSTLNLLKAEGVDYFQGYFIGKPIPLTTFWEKNSQQQKPYQASS